MAVRRQYTGGTRTNTHTMALRPLGKGVGNQGMQLMCNILVNLCLFRGLCLQAAEGHEKGRAIVRIKARLLKRYRPV